VPIRMVKDGATIDVPDEMVAEAARQGYVPQSAEARAQAITNEVVKEQHTGVGATIAAGITGVARGATLGLSDAALSALGEGKYLRRLREHNQGASLAGELLGSLSPAGPAGAAGRLGASIAKPAVGATGLAKIARAGAGGLVEGGILGAGQGVSELALSDDPLTAERVASVLSSRALYGGAIGGAAGSLAKAAEVGLSKGRDALVAARARMQAGAELGDDLTKLDRAGLRAAKEAEEKAIATARVGERSSIADDIASHYQAGQTEKVWLATAGAEEKALREVGAVTLRADKAVRRLLDNPKDLAAAPQRALTALRLQETAIEKLIAKSDDLALKFAADTSGDRAAAFANAPRLLERNRAIQARIEQVMAKPASARLTAIETAGDMLADGGKKAGMVEQMVSGSVFGMAAGATATLPVLGPMLAPFAGAAAARMVGEKVFGRLSKASLESVERAGRAVETFLGVASKVAPYAPRVATRTLAAVTFKGGDRDEKAEGKRSLADLYRARSEEIRSQVEPGPAGVPQMDAMSRRRVASRFDSVRAASPMLADRMETIAARRVEFLAAKMPRRPDSAAIQTGPDRWQPSDLAMRAWARYVDAVEDPIGVFERATVGRVSPEDAEAMRAVYPEMLSDITQQIVSQLPTLQARLPYHRRLALSILTGVAVDPAMEPSILAALQAQYATEGGTEGGTEPTRAMPQFGSVKAPDPTPAQTRAG
jgi:hypothetical protein